MHLFFFDFYLDRYKTKFIILEARYYAETSLASFVEVFTSTFSASPQTTGSLSALQA